jgi:hypothetical protein
MKMRAQVESMLSKLQKILYSIVSISLSTLDILSSHLGTKHSSVDIFN